MTIDKYTKLILSLIAIGIIGINFHLFKINFIEQAIASPSNMSIVATTFHSGKESIFLITEDGEYGCAIPRSRFEYKEWVKTGC